MQNKGKTFGNLVSAAVAGLFVASPLLAANGKAKPKADHKAANGKKSSWFCENNSCQGKSECTGHGGGDSCSGTNSCKGHGWITAKDAKACKAKGGIWKKDEGK